MATILLSAEDAQQVLDLYSDRAAVMGRIKQVMDQFDISGRALAREMGRDPALISRWFRTGKPVPTLDTVLEIQLAVDAIVQRAQ